MTPSEVIEIAARHAGEVDGPWSPEKSVAKRRRAWPFSPFWRVVLRTQNGNVTFTMNVFESTGEVRPIRRVWGANIHAPVQPRLVLLFVFKLAVSGGLAWLVARYLTNWPLWRAILFTIPASLAGVIFYELLEARIRMAKYDKED